MLLFKELVAEKSRSKLTLMGIEKLVNKLPLLLLLLECVVRLIASLSY
jgi:hypothetical protein